MINIKLYYSVSATLVSLMLQCVSKLIFSPPTLTVLDYLPSENLGLARCTWLSNAHRTHAICEHGIN